MIIGFTGFAFKPSSGFPAYGTFLSGACTYADGYDYYNTYWNGEWNYSVTRADGTGGSYTNVEGNNTSGCWVPYGYVYSASNYDLQHGWSHGNDSGTFIYGYNSVSTYSDGFGGSIGTGGDNITATDNQVVHAYGFIDGTTGYPMTSTLYFEADDNLLYESNFVDAGTEVGASCDASWIDDAQSQAFYVPHRVVIYADGSGGSYVSYSYNTPECGYYPSGFWTSYSNNNIGLSYSDEYSNMLNFDYGNYFNGYVADGSGNNNFSDGTNIWYGSGYVFYSYYDGVGMVTVNYAFDGSSGYYTYTT